MEVLGQVEYRDQRHEACEAALAILEREVDRLRVALGDVLARADASGPEETGREDTDQTDA